MDIRWIYLSHDKVRIVDTLSFLPFIFHNLIALFVLSADVGDR